MLLKAIINLGILTDTFKRLIRLADGLIVKEGVIVKIKLIIIMVGKYRETIDFEVSYLGKENIILERL